jgi:hypothetical protein
MRDAGERSTGPAPGERVDVRKLLWVGPLTVLAAVAAVLVVRVAAAWLLDPPATFQPLGWGPPIVFTVLGVLMGVLVFAVMGRRLRRPIRTFQGVAFVALLVSFLPDLSLLLALGRAAPAGGPPGMSLEGVTPPMVVALMVMHVAAWAVAVTLPTRLAREG